MSEVVYNIEREVALLVDKLVSTVVTSNAVYADAFSNQTESSNCYDLPAEFESPLKRKVALSRRLVPFNPNRTRPQSNFQRSTRSESDLRRPITNNELKTKSTAIGYVFSPNLINEANRLPKVKGRAILVHELIQAYGLLDSMSIIPSKAATEHQLRTFHSEDYINYIKAMDAKSQSVIHDPENNELDHSIVGEEYGFGYDCAAIKNTMSLISNLAGGTLAAANAVLSGQFKVAINWTGGWHHGLKDEASGYCYVNDIVIAILEVLSRGVERVLYIDYDLHHGDGVESAFAHSKKVLTVSLHKYEVGFFPGTGSVDETGFGRNGKGYAVNVPIKDGIGDDLYSWLANEVLIAAVENYKPQLVFAQFGADTLIEDPMKGFNLTLDGPANCLKQLMKLDLPTVILGGGGYNLVNTAKLWTHLTGLVVGKELDLQIPDHRFFLDYRPSYELFIEKGLRKDSNSKQELEIILEGVKNNLSKIKIGNQF